MKAENSIDNIGDEKLNFRVINLGDNIDLPTIRETGYRDWVEFGLDNQFPQFLIDVFHTKSITHKTIINRKVKMVAGEGFEKPTDEAGLSLWRNVYSDDNLDDILYKITFDLEINGGFCLGVRWSQDGTKISEIYHIPFESVRIDKGNDSSNGLPNYYWISDDWSNVRREKPKKYQGFSKKYLDNKNQVLYVKQYQPGSNMVYSIPDYFSSINWVLAEWEISNFHRATIQNGFNAGFILNFATGIPNPEEMERAYKEIKNKYTGTFNAGRFILTFSNGKEQEPRLSPIPLADTDSRYTELNDLIRQNIFTANEVTTPELFGVSTPGKLGNKAELLEGLEIFQSVYVNYKQNFIEKVINKLGDINGAEPLVIKKYEIDIQKIEG